MQHGDSLLGGGRRGGDSLSAGFEKRTSIDDKRNHSVRKTYRIRLRCILGPIILINLPIKSA